MPVEATDEEPEELVPSPEAWTMPGAEGDLELLAEEQVLDDQTLKAADGGDEGGQDGPDEFEHRVRIADHDSRQDRRTDFCPPTPGRCSGAGPSFSSRASAGDTFRLTRRYAPTPIAPGAGRPVGMRGPGYDRRLEWSAAPA